MTTIRSTDGGRFDFEDVKYSPDQPRGEAGRWEAGSSAARNEAPYVKQPRPSEIREHLEKAHGRKFGMNISGSRYQNNDDLRLHDELHRGQIDYRTRKPSAPPVTHQHEMTPRQQAAVARQNEERRIANLNEAIRLRGGLRF